MANTTFKGTVRAEGGLSVISTADATGVETTHTSISSTTGNTSIGGTLAVTGATTLTGATTANNTVTISGAKGINRTARAIDRVYLEEFFLQRPALNAVNIIDPDANDASALAATQAANKNFEILGTNASTDDVTFSATRGGIELTLDGADNDQIIILPHLDTNQTAWTGTKWGSENQTEWECLITTGAAITNTCIWAGLKLTNTPTIATDADQAYFIYATDDDLGTITTQANWHFAYSVGGTDYLSDLNLAVAANTIYHLKIIIDSDRKPAAFINGTQYSLTSTATGGGVDTAAGTTLGSALTDDKDFIPYIGIQALAAEAKTLHVGYEAINRYMYE